ncbi:MAG: hypothetical protein M3004_09790 [Bacteroidota bacterium]|nr:hypothetical protein [Bacteroidota bacterium]
MNEEEERRLMNRFRKEYQNFPKGRLKRKNPPFADFLLKKTKGKTIGIELTEIFSDNKLKEVSSFKEQFTNAVLKKLSPLLPFTFSIDIDFDSKFKIEKSKLYKLAGTIVNICVNEFFHTKNHEGINLHHIEIDLEEISNLEIKSNLINNGYRHLPKGISSISLHRYDGVSKSWNSQHEGGTVPNLTLDYLQPLLNKKEHKLQKYIACDEFWLIINEGNYHAGSFDDIKLDLPIKTTFNKVFIYRSSKNEILDLTEPISNE